MSMSEVQLNAVLDVVFNVPLYPVLWVTRGMCGVVPTGKGDSTGENAPILVQTCYIQVGARPMVPRGAPYRVWKLNEERIVTFAA